MFLHLVQFSIDTTNPAANRTRVKDLLRETMTAPGSLIVLPELFSTGVLPHGMESAQAVRLIEEDRSFLADLARETGAFVAAGILGVADDALSNLCVILNPDGAVISTYSKIHPFSLGGEDKVFAPGNAVSVTAVGDFTVQTTVCYDLRFPELFRVGSRAGADLIVVPANWPASRREHWDVLLRARAIENQCYVVGLNCVGTQHGTNYAGGSAIVSPKGEVLASGGEREGVVTAEVSADHVRAWRRVFPALRDRKPNEFWESRG